MAAGGRRRRLSCLCLCVFGVGVLPEYKPSRWSIKPTRQPCLKPRRHAVHASGTRLATSPPIVITMVGKASAMACCGLTRLDALSMIVITPRIAPQQAKSAGNTARQLATRYIRCHLMSAATSWRRSSCLGLPSGPGQHRAERCYSRGRVQTFGCS